MNIYTKHSKRVPTPRRGSAPIRTYIEGNVGCVLEERTVKTKLLQFFTRSAFCRSQTSRMYFETGWSRDAERQVANAIRKEAAAFREFYRMVCEYLDRPKETRQPDAWPVFVARCLDFGSTNIALAYRLCYVDEVPIASDLARINEFQGGRRPYGTVHVARLDQTAARFEGSLALFRDHVTDVAIRIVDRDWREGYRSVMAPAELVAAWVFAPHWIWLWDKLAQWLDVRSIAASIRTDEGRHIIAEMLYALARSKPVANDATRVAGRPQTRIEILKLDSLTKSDTRRARLIGHGLLANVDTTLGVRAAFFPVVFAKYAVERSERSDLLLFLDERTALRQFRKWRDWELLEFKGSRSESERDRLSKIWIAWLRRMDSHPSIRDRFSRSASRDEPRGFLLRLRRDQFACSIRNPSADLSL